MRPDHVEVLGASDLPDRLAQALAAACRTRLIVAAQAIQIAMAGQYGEVEMRVDPTG